MEKLNSFLALLKEKYNQQGQWGKVLLPAVFLLVVCCFSVLVLRLLPAGSRNAPALTASPLVLPSQGPGATPTALFDFSATLFPSPVAPSALPTTPGPATQAPTLSVSTDTVVPLPTLPTNTNAPASNTGSVQIVGVNKPEEYVEIQNAGGAPVDLNGWKLISETGDQSCLLKGVLQPSEILRIWARLGTTGFSCGYLINIWNDNSPDPAVLYDAQGKEVSSFP